MPTRNPSSRSLRADIAVLNPTTGKMEFPKASKVSQRSIYTNEELNDWGELGARIERQSNGPMFQPDFKITDEVRKDFEDMFGSFKLETEDWKSGKTKEFWKRYGDENDFLTASEDKIKLWIKESQQQLFEEAKQYKDNQSKYNDNNEHKLYLLGKDKASPERIAELEKLRKDSQVQDIIYRGQDAYEVLDSKKASEVIAEMRKKDRESGGEHYKRGIGYTGSQGDGLYHLTPHGSYANSYGNDGDTPTSGVIQGVLISKKLLDLTPLTASEDIYQSVNNKAFWGRFEKYYGKNTAPYDHGWANTRGVGPTYEEALAFRKAPHRNGGTNEENLGKISESQLVTWKWAGAIADTIASNYQRVNGTPMPANIGKVKSDTSNDTLQERIYADFGKRGGYTYQLLKTPTFKRVMKQAGFDAVKYLDYGVSLTSPLGTPAYGATKPTQFKSYFGDKKVDLKSPNVFDAD